MPLRRRQLIRSPRAVSAVPTGSPHVEPANPGSACGQLRNSAGKGTAFALRPSRHGQDQDCAAHNEGVRQDAQELGHNRAVDRRLSPVHVPGHSKPLARPSPGKEPARPRQAAAGERAVLHTPGTPAPEFTLPITADRHGRGQIPVTVPQASCGLRLDPDVLARVQADTDRVTALLVEQFAQAGTTSGTVAGSDPPSGHPAPAGGSRALAELARASLNPAHRALLRGLTAHARWSRQAFNALCETQRLLPGGAVDTLNEAAFETCGEPLLDGHDPIDINEYALQELQK